MIDKLATDITCLDDVPEVGRVAARQEFLTRWLKVIAIAPFILVVIIFTFIFPKAESTTQFIFGSLAIIWAGLILGYTISLQFRLRCPVCGWRFGIQDKCRSCGLPRHRYSDEADELRIT